MYSLFNKTENKSLQSVEGIISVQRNLETGLRFQQNSKREGATKGGVLK